MSNKHFVVFISLFVFNDAFLISDIEEWRAFKKEHSKHYDSITDEIHHFRIFVDHKHKIAENNLHHENGVGHFKMSINKYSDWSHEHFIKRMNGFKFNIESIHHDDVPTLPTGFEDIDLPKSVDWRTKGAVTEVKDQAGCGSCYSFATVGAVESNYFLKTGHLISLSEQDVIDCSKSYGNYGCDGGEQESTLNYIKDHGISYEDTYPYEAHEDLHCLVYAKKSNVRVKGFNRIPSGNEKELQKALVHGPVVVGMDASGESFMHFGYPGTNDIYYDSMCSSLHLDHAILLVGYGTDEYERDYYIAKNSWGPTWGDRGYFKIARNHNNHCGIATEAIYPIFEL